MKVDNNEVWKDVKAGKYLGLSIEGIFSDKKEDLNAIDKVLNICDKEVDDMTDEEAQGLLNIIKKLCTDEG